MAEFLNNNVKYLRNEKNISQQKLADDIGVDRSTISRIENGEIETTIDNAIKIANVLNVPLNDLVSKNLQFDNAQFIDARPVDTIKIPVLGVIKAGIPIEAQENIVEYIDIPTSWIKGGKSFYGLKIDGDSMYPKYQTNDIVIFEKTEDSSVANGKDCAIMVNGFDATFKKFNINNDGVTLTPLNQDNSDGFPTTFYNAEQVLNLPVRIIGIAVEKRTRL